MLSLMQLVTRRTFPGNYKGDLIDTIIVLSGEPDIFQPLLEKWKAIRFHWQLKLVKYMAAYSVYQPQLLALVDNSSLIPVLKRVEHYWKHELILTGVRLGSFMAASAQFSLFTSKLRISGYIRLKSTDFERFSSLQPE